MEAFSKMEEKQNQMAEIETLRSALKSESQRLWKLASNPFAVLGEARVTESGITLVPLGDVPPEQKLGIAPGSFPTSIEAILPMIHPVDRQPFRQAVSHSQATGEPFDMKYRLADGCGGWRFIEGQAVSVEVRDGSHFAWLFSMRDFSEQRETEDKLRQSLLKLENSRCELKSEQEKLWRLAANAFSVFTEVHVLEHEIELKCFGGMPVEGKISIKPGTLPDTAEKLISMIHPEDVASFRKNMEISLSTGEPFKVIYRIADGYGGWRWLDVRGFSLEERNGIHVRWLTDTRDITEQKEAEMALSRSLDELQQLKTQLQLENISLREELERGSMHVEIIGRSASLVRILEQVKLVAATSSTVLITGETGTGKEQIARFIHRQSSRQDRRFVVVNCAALPATLVESELFGHEKGAFTGAVALRRGRFEQAEGGTIFLDEIGELPLESQSKLLRVLQTGECERIGGQRTLKVNVRVIAASNRNLAQEVTDGRFRDDLYHRLAVFPIHIPPLRERREDIPLLAAYMITRKGFQLGRKIESISSDALAKMASYGWPGNIRELENVIERAIILSPGPVLNLDAIQLKPVAPPNDRKKHPHIEATADSGTDDSLLAIEREHILRVCNTCNWKIKGPDGAATVLGINPGTLYARMRKLGIQRPVS
jgi:DNA-binding NtrC family response regulator